MQDMQITRYDSYEILKVDDLNHGEQQCIENMNAILQHLIYASNDVIINGLIVQQTAAPSMAVDVTAGLGFCQSTSKMFHSASLVASASISNGDATNDRIDVIEARVLETAFDEQQRAFKNPTTGVPSYQDWYTKMRYEIEVQVVEGTPAASPVAPNHTAGWVKLAEVLVAANESTSILNADIENVDATYDGQANSTWTTETAVTFKLRTWTTANADDIPITDTAGYFNSTNVEGALAELKSYDLVIHNQDEFNAIIERVAANQYKIADGVRSIFVKYLSGGYQMTGGSSPLSGGDTWGYIETNNCVTIVFAGGAFIDMHQERGYVEVNTDYCCLNRVSIQGDKGAASAIARSFLLNANYVTFNGCESKTRLSNTTFSVFEGSATALHNENSNYVKCSVSDCDGTSFRAFYLCHNLDNIYIYDIATTGATYLIYQCCNVNNFEIDKIDITGATGHLIYQSEGVSNGIISDCDSDDLLRAVAACYNCSNITVSDIESSNSALGFQQCERIVNCKAIQIDVTAGAQNCAGFYDCEDVTNCYAEDIDQTGTGDAYGFRLCDRLSCCEAQDVDSSAGSYHGFYECTELSSCYARTCEDGCNDCKEIVGCKVEDNDNNGFTSCDDVSGCRAATNGNDGYNGCTCVTACRGNNNTGNGFDGCNTMTANRAAGNTAAQYNNSFADLAGLNACADTAAGGYNG